MKKEIRLKKELQDSPLFEKWPNTITIVSEGVTESWEEYHPENKEKWGFYVDKNGNQYPKIFIDDTYESVE